MLGLPAALRLSKVNIRLSVSGRARGVLAARPAEQKALDLATGRLGQLVDEVHVSGVGVRGVPGADVFLQLGGQLIAAVAPTRHDERLHDLAAHLVRDADDRALGHGRVRGQNRLDVERADPVAGHEDDVVVAAGEVEIAVGVHRPAVPGEVVAAVAGELLARLRGVAVVAPEPHQRTPHDVHGDPADLAHRGGRVGVPVEHGEHEPGHRASHRRRPDLGAYVRVVAVDRDHAQLGLPVVVQHRHAQRVERPLHHVRGQRLSRARRRPQREPARHRETGRAQRPEHRRRGRDAAHPQLVEHPPEHRRGEVRRQQHGPAAGGQRRAQRVVQPVGPTRVGGVPVDIVASHVQAQFQVGDERGQRPGGHEHPLWPARRAGRVELQERPVRALHRRLTVPRVPARHRVPGDVALPGPVAHGHDPPRRIRGHVGPGVELDPLPAVAHDHRRATGLQPHHDPLRGERGEQRHVHRSQPPHRQQHDRQLQPLWQQRRHPTARPHPQRRQPGGERLRPAAQLAVGHIDRARISDNGDRHRPRIVPIAERASHAKFGVLVLGEQRLDPFGHGHGSPPPCRRKAAPTAAIRRVSERRCQVRHLRGAPRRPAAGAGRPPAPGTDHRTTPTALPNLAPLALRGWIAGVPVEVRLPGLDTPLPAQGSLVSLAGPGSGDAARRREEVVRDDWRCPVHRGVPGLCGGGRRSLDDRAGRGNQPGLALGDHRCRRRCGGAGPDRGRARPGRDRDPARWAAAGRRRATADFRVAVVLVFRSYAAAAAQARA